MPTCWRPWAGRSFRRAITRSMAAERRGRERTAEANEGRARLLKQVMSAREEEQRRISRDLHDGIGQSLTSLLLGLRAAAEVPTFEEARARMWELRGITASLLDEVRRLARDLRRAFWTISALRQPWNATRPITPMPHGIAVDVVRPGPGLGPSAGRSGDGFVPHRPGGPHECPEARGGECG